MADVQKTVEIVFGTVNKSGQGITSFGKDLDGLAGSAKSVAGPLGDLSEGMLKVEATAIAAGVALAGLAVNQSGKLSASVNEIGTLFGGTSKEIEAFKSQIVDYANSSTQSLDSITQSVYTAVSAGVDYKDALDVLTVAEQLSVAGKADLNSSLDVLTSSLNAYGASTTEAADYSDTLFTAVRLGKTTLPELASGLAQVTGLAASTGVSFDELNAAIAALTATGLPTKQAITAIKAALSNILKPAKDAREQASEIGLEFNVAALQAKGFGGFMEEVAQKTGGSAEQLARLFGSVEGLNGVLALTGKASGRFNDALEGMEKKAGAVSDAFKIMSENLDLVHTNLSNRLNTALASAGDELIAQYGDLARSLGDLFGGFKISIDAGSLDGLFDILNQAQSELAAWISGVAEALPEALAGLDFSGLAAAFDNLGGSVSSLFNGLDLTKPKDLREVTQFAVDALTSLTNITSGIVDGLKPYIDWLANMVARTVELGPETEEVAGQILGFAEGLSKVLNLAGGVGDSLVGIGDGLTYIAGAMIGKELLKNTKGLAVNLGGVAGAASRMLPFIKKLLGKGGVVGLGVALGTLLEKTTGLGSALNDWWPDAWAYEGATIGTVIADLVEKFKRLTDQSPEVKKAFEEQAEWLRKEREELGYLSKETETTTEITRDYNKEVEDMAKAQSQAAEDAAKTKKAEEELSEIMKGQGLVLNEVTGAWEKLESKQNAANKSQNSQKELSDKNKYPETNKLLDEKENNSPFNKGDSDALKTVKTYRLIAEAVDAARRGTKGYKEKIEEASKAINELGKEGRTSKYTLESMEKAIKGATGTDSILELSAKVDIVDLGIEGIDDITAKVNSIIEGAVQPKIIPMIDPVALGGIASEIDSLNGRKVIVEVIPDMSNVPSSITVPVVPASDLGVTAEQSGGRS